MAAELDPPVSGGARGRRPRRTVITDDSYGDDGYLERDGGEGQAPRAPTAPALEKARAAAARTRAPAKPIARQEPSAPRDNAGRVVWRLAGLATFMWLGGVLAFATGFFQLPLEPLDALPRAAASLPPHLILMTLAVALAPLGLIWLTALSARRAEAIRAETQELAARLGGGAASGDRSLADAEASLEAAREALEKEKEALQALLRSVESGALDAAPTAGAPMEKPHRAPSRAERATVGLEPKSMLAGAPRPQTTHADMPDEDDEDGEEGEEFAPALGVERSAPSSPAARVKIGDGPIDGNGRGRRQLQEIDRLKARVEGARPGAPAPKSAPAPAPRPAPSSALDWGKLIAAANFPESEEDQETLDALYAVLTDSETAALLQAAEDALSGLADIGLFMEDMQPHHAPMDLWRSYIVDGTKTDVLDIGGIRDTHAIEDTSEALRTKGDFAKTSDRFMARYETMVERLFAEAPEPTMVVELADTRTGRAYMLLARASGRLG